MSSLNRALNWLLKAWSSVVLFAVTHGRKKTSAKSCQSPDQSVFLQPSFAYSVAALVTLQSKDFSERLVT